MLTHRNLVANLAVLDSVASLCGDDVALAVLPPGFPTWARSAILCC